MMENPGGMEKKAYPTRAGDYKLLEDCGHGVSAIVYRALCVPLNEIVAIKVLDLEKCNSNLDEIRREATTMSLINHPNVVRAYCSFVVDQSLWVVMPFLSGGSCLHVMKSAFPEGFEELVIATILKETLKALEYLHRHGHIHRDVKAGNILIDSNGAVKLADFGVSACMFDTGDRQRSRQTFVGTPCWMAPEVMEQIHGYDFKADMWSFGITALELAHGHAPFSKYPPMKVLLMTLQHAPPSLDLDRDKRFSKSFKEMIASCLVKDPAKRPTADKLMKHPFFKQARSADFLVRHVLQGLPPLGERVRTLKAKDAARLAAKKMPLGEQEEVSQNEYRRGVSSWNFSLDDLKLQASLAKEEEEELGGSHAPSSSDEGSGGGGRGVSGKGGGGGGGGGGGTRGSQSDAESEPSPPQGVSPKAAVKPTVFSSSTNSASISVSAAATSALEREREREKERVMGGKGEGGGDRDGGGAAGGGAGYGGGGLIRGRSSRGPTPPPPAQIQVAVQGEGQNGNNRFAPGNGGGGGVFSPKAADLIHGSGQSSAITQAAAAAAAAAASAPQLGSSGRKEAVVGAKHVGRLDGESADIDYNSSGRASSGGGVMVRVVGERGGSVVSMERETQAQVRPSIQQPQTTVQRSASSSERERSDVVGGDRGDRVVGERMSRHSSGLERVAAVSAEHRSALDRDHRGSFGGTSADRQLGNGGPGPILRTSATSLSGAAGMMSSLKEDVSKDGKVVVKGRFSVTSADVDVAPLAATKRSLNHQTAPVVIGKGGMHKSPSAGDWSLVSQVERGSKIHHTTISSASPAMANMNPAVVVPAAAAPSSTVPIVTIMPHLQTMMHHVISEQDVLLNLMSCLSSSDPTTMAASRNKMGGRDPDHTEAPTERERDLLRQVVELQTRIAALTEQLEGVKVKNVVLERKLNTISNEEEERRIQAEERERRPEVD